MTAERPVSRESADAGPSDDAAFLKRKADYFRAVAEETGKQRLRELFHLTRLIARHRDIERRLLESEQRYRTVVETLTGGMLVVSEGRIVFANGAALRFLGLPREELLADPDPFRHVHPEDREAVRTRHQQRLAGRPVPDPFVFRLVTPAGETRWMEATGAPLEWEGKPAALNFLMDVTERVRAAEREKQLAEQLHRAQKMEALGTLAGGIAHDFNNLMASALAHVSLLLCETDPSHPWHEPLTQIERQIRRGAQLTSRLLAHLRRRPERKTPVDVNRLVHEVLDVFGRTRKDIRRVTELATDLPPILADDSQIEQVLLNLFVNAADAIPEGGTLTVRTRRLDLAEGTPPAAPAAGVEVAVADTGIGMTPDVLERIFDPFFTTKEYGRGTGLGLASVYGIVRGHGGRIDVTSRPGQGSRFTLWFPAAKATAPAEPAAARAPSRIDRRSTVLLVDDEPSVIDSASRMLERLGFSVIRAPGGEEALALFSRHKDEIDLVVLDVVMPGTGGEAVYRRIREMRPETRILVASGYDLGGRMTPLLRRGRDGFIQKPYDLQELSQAIAEVFAAP